MSDDEEDADEMESFESESRDSLSTNIDWNDRE